MQEITVPQTIGADEGTTNEITVGELVPSSVQIAQRPANLISILTAMNADDIKAAMQNYVDVLHALVRGQDMYYTVRFKMSGRPYTEYYTSKQAAQKREESLKNQALVTDVIVTENFSKSAWLMLFRTLNMTPYMFDKYNETVEVISVNGVEMLRRVREMPGERVVTWEGFNEDKHRFIESADVELFYEIAGNRFTGRGSFSSSERGIAHPTHDVVKMAYARAIADLMSKVLPVASRADEENLDELPIGYTPPSSETTTAADVKVSFADALNTAKECGIDPQALTKIVNDEFGGFGAIEDWQKVIDYIKEHCNEAAHNGG